MLRGGSSSLKSPSSGPMHTPSDPWPRGVSVEAIDEIVAEPAAAAAATAPPAPIGQVLVQAGEATQDAVELARMEQGLGDNRPLGSILVEHGATTPAAVEGALEAQGGATADQGNVHRSV